MTSFIQTLIDDARAIQDGTLTTIDTTGWSDEEFLAFLFGDRSADRTADTDKQETITKDGDVHRT